MRDKYKFKRASKEAQICQSLPQILFDSQISSWLRQILYAKFSIDCQPSMTTTELRHGPWILKKLPKCFRVLYVQSSSITLTLCNISNLFHFHFFSIFPTLWCLPGHEQTTFLNLHSRKFSTHIFYTGLRVLSRRICLTTESFLRWCSFSSFSWP